MVSVPVDFPFVCVCGCYPLLAHSWSVRVVSSAEYETCLFFREKSRETVKPKAKLFAFSVCFSFLNAIENKI